MYAVPVDAKKRGMNYSTDRVAVLTVEKAHEIFHEFHSSAIGGHTGIRRTIQNVSRCFKWKNMTTHLTRWVRILMTMDSPRFMLLRYTFASKVVYYNFQKDSVTRHSQDSLYQKSPGTFTNPHCSILESSLLTIMLFNDRKINIISCGVNSFSSSIFHIFITSHS